MSNSVAPCVFVAVRIREGEGAAATHDTTVIVTAESSERFGDQGTHLEGDPNRRRRPLDRVGRIDDRSGDAAPCRRVRDERGGLETPGRSDAEERGRAIGDRARWPGAPSAEHPEHDLDKRHHHRQLHAARGHETRDASAAGAAGELPDRCCRSRGFLVSCEPVDRNPQTFLSSHPPHRCVSS